MKRSSQQSASLPLELQTSSPAQLSYQRLFAALGVVVVLYAAVIGPYAYLNQTEKTRSAAVGPAGNSKITNVYTNKEIGREEK